MKTNNKVNYYQLCDVDVCVCRVVVFLYGFRVIIWYHIFIVIEKSKRVNIVEWLNKNISTSSNDLHAIKKNNHRIMYIFNVLILISRVSFRLHN